MNSKIRKSVALIVVQPDNETLRAGISKPDSDIFRQVLDIAHVLPENGLYILETLMFVDIARDLGIRSIHHTIANQHFRKFHHLK